MADTIKHQGIVENIIGSQIFVRIVQTTGCASCSARGYCIVTGITNIAVYLDGRLALVRTLQRGGENVTRDIAAVLQTTTEEAERIKILHGCVDLSVVKPDHMIQVQAIDGQQTISRIELAEIIIARYEEIFTSIREELERSGAIHGLYHGVVLTGDACQIEGMVNLARRMLGVSAHLGNPPLQVYANVIVNPFQDNMPMRGEVAFDDVQLKVFKPFIKDVVS